MLLLLFTDFVFQSVNQMKEEMEVNAYCLVMTPYYNEDNAKDLTSVPSLNKELTLCQYSVNS